MGHETDAMTPEPLRDATITAMAARSRLMREFDRQVGKTRRRKRLKAGSGLPVRPRPLVLATEETPRRPHRHPIYRGEPTFPPDRRRAGSEGSEDYEDCMIMNPHDAVAAEVDRLLHPPQITEADLLAIDSEPQFWRDAWRAAMSGADALAIDRYGKLAEK
jgi:hypothetical protein